MPGLILRGFAPGDLDAMHALDVLCFEPPFRFTRSAMRRFATAKKARVAIAELDDTLAGFAILHIEASPQLRAAYIVTLDVAPPYRRQGIAGALMAAMEREALAAQCTLLALHVFAGNAAATRFYERSGYRRSHISPGFYGPGLDALVYNKPLRNGPLRVT
jgi:ribosomal-protein-alanine N-acetyltransferase